MIINVDITTALMYKPGPLMDVALEFLNKKPGQYQALDAPMNDAERRSLTKFLFRLRITTTHVPRPAGKSRGIVSIKPTSAAGTSFTRDGQTQTIQHYFEATYRRKLKYPKAVLVEVSRKGDFSQFVGLIIRSFWLDRAGDLASDRSLRDHPWAAAEGAAASGHHQDHGRVRDEEARGAVGGHSFRSSGPPYSLPRGLSFDKADMSSVCV